MRTDTKVHVYSESENQMILDTVVRLRDENAKLRQECDHWHVEQVHAYGNWEDAHKRSSELESENAKLRKLCADMWRDVPKTESCGWDADANCCTGSNECAGECGYWYRMRELGIEVRE